MVGSTAAQPPGFCNTLTFSSGLLVPYWITFNEPWTFAVMGFNVLFPTDCGGTCPYINTYNVIKSHALAYRRYETKYKSKQNGQVGITLNAAFSFPGTEKPEDVLATEKGMQFILGLYSNPIFGNGDWPEIVKTTVANRSKAEGFTLSRLPEFTADEKIKISGSFDFFGLNVYTATVTYGVPDSFCYTTKENASYYAEICVDSKAREQWPKAGSDWLRYTPFAPRGLLKWIKDHYGDVPVIITETGWSDLNGYTDDPWRSKFYTNYINSALQAYKLDKCNLKGFTAWSLMDNFEWLKGYSERFGLHYVNFSDPRRPRIPKQSAFAYGEIAKNNGFPDLTKPSTTTPSAANAVVDGSVSRNIFLSFVVIANVRHF